MHHRRFPTGSRRFYFMTTNTDLFLFHDFADTDAEELGKPFDGMSHGTFTSMWGNVVKISKSSLKNFTENTKRLLESTRGESGEIVGIAIDTRNHERGDSAGFVVAVELSDDGEIVRFTPKWNDVGRALISENKLRYFSPTLDMENEVIVGGSLTNYPATRAKNGDHILRPIELAQAHNLMYRSDEMPANKKTAEGAPVGALNLTEEQLTALISKAVQAELAANPPAPVPGDKPEGDKPEGFNVDDVIEKIRGELVIDKAGGMLDMESVRKSMYGTIRSALELEYKKLQDNAASMLEAMMQESRTRTHVADFARRVTGGTEDNPNGLPVDFERLESVLLKVEDAGVRAELEAIFDGVWKNGLTEFEELGTGGGRGAKKKLPEYYAAKLTAGEISLSDLRNPIIAHDIGDPNEYDLSAWKEAAA